MKAQTRKLPRYAGTYRGVQEWYVAMFEKLGWMVLAQAKGMRGKVTEYKKSVNRLIKTMEHLRTEYENQNKLHDLNVLLMNARVLQQHIEKDF